MVAHLTSSEWWSECKTDREQAWHLLSILLKIRRPTRPVELALKCSLFRPSPVFVEYLCSIPDSPLCLTDDKLVTVSLAAASSIDGFETEEIFKHFRPIVTVRVSGSEGLFDRVKTYVRKRKGQRLDASLLPPLKRRSISSSGENEDDQTQMTLMDRIARSIKVIDDTNMPVVRPESHNSGTSFKDGEMIPLLIGNNIDFQRRGYMKIEHIKDENASEINIVVDRELLESVHVSGCQHSEKTIAEGRDLENDQKPSLQLCTMESEEVCDELYVSDSDVICVSDTDVRNRSVFTTRACLEGCTQFDASPEEAGLPDTNGCETARSRVLQIYATESSLEAHELYKELHISEIELTNEIARTCPEAMTQFDASLLEVAIHDRHAYEAPRNRILESPGKESCTNGWSLKTSGATGEGSKGSVPANITAQAHGTHKSEFTFMNLNNDMMTSVDIEKTACMWENQPVYPSGASFSAKMQPESSYSNMMRVNKDTSNKGPPVLLELLGNKRVLSSPKQREQCQQDDKCSPIKQKLNKGHNFMLTKDSRADSTSVTPKNKLEAKALPHFEDFIVEEEEGSGGYGTVYRAHRKNDGKTFAIKCPHVNAHIHHVNNELKMLERFGGRNYVIKFERSFKSSNSECFVLEHVEHDRPEVLRREIDIYQLQWYGYCMFRALGSLHKQGIVHRDIKPGNFLFSRKLNKGYLIDFNLATDLNHKYGTSGKSKMSCSASSDHFSLPSAKADPSTKSRKVMGNRFPDGDTGETKKDTRKLLEPKTMKKRADVGPSRAYPDMGSRHKFKAQGADGSGITSTKDITSTRTPPAERQRQPLPSQGRKELINLAQQAMQSPNHKGASVPTSQRKRIAAPPGKVERKFFYLTPMPVHSNGIAVAGAGLFKNKGDGKQKREGPCVGTKGFRAPEVLFKSPHQGPKVDVWSAGVTFLYLMIGRTPFTGDPEQNIKDIAKLRGSEDLWELAKLHNRESSFPSELFDFQSLRSMKLKEWCKMNTRRPNFIDDIPNSLFDLVDKCLTVNPRLRITAEEALNHEFFAPCLEGLRKQRQLRCGLSLNSESSQHRNKYSRL